MTEDQLPKLAQEIKIKIETLKNIDKAVVVFLSGDLGAGKTTFTKLLGKELYIKEDISSPTFVILKRYEIKDFVFKNLIHIDAYRLEGFYELNKLKIKEYIDNGENIILIEWPELVQSDVLIPDLVLRFEHGETEGERVVVIG